MKFSRLLKLLRAKKQVSIKKLAMDMAVNYTYISKLENAKAMPSRNVVNRFSNYFNYSSDELMLAADKIPEDIQHILKTNPTEAIKYLRKRFGATPAEKK